MAAALCEQWCALSSSQYTRAKLETILPTTSRDIHRFINIIYYS